MADFATAIRDLAAEATATLAGIRRLAEGEDLEAIGAAVALVRLDVAVAELEMVRRTLVAAQTGKETADDRRPD